MARSCISTRRGEVLDPQSAVPFEQGAEQKTVGDPLGLGVEGQHLRLAGPAAGDQAIDVVLRRDAVAAKIFVESRQRGRNLLQIEHPLANAGKNGGAVPRETET